MHRKISYASNDRTEETHSRPPKPPRHNKELDQDITKSKYSLQDKNSKIVPTNTDPKHKVRILDYANYGKFEKGGGKESRKEELYRKVKKLQPRKEDGPPYQTLHPDDGVKQAGYQGGNIKKLC